MSAVILLKTTLNALRILLKSEVDAAEICSFWDENRLLILFGKL